MTHADDLQAVSVDEALLDVTSSVRRIRTEMSLSQSGEEDSLALIGDPAKDFAEAIRTQVRNATGCEGNGLSLIVIALILITCMLSSEHWDRAQHHVGSACLQKSQTRRVLSSPAYERLVLHGKPGH